MPQRAWAMLTVGLAITMAVLDSSIANVALPTIAGDMAASPATAIWIVNAYQLVITMTLLPLAALGALYEYRRVYRIGLAVFTVASLACALSHSIIELTGARVLQGLGAAGIMSVNAALIRFIYPRAQLGRAIGINAVTVSISAAVGPTVASLVLSVASWEWLFAINLPIGLVALLGARSLPVTPRGKHRFDSVGAVLSAATFGLLITTIDAVGHHAPLALIAAEGVATILVGTVLVWRETHRAWPLLPVDLMRVRLFSLSIATSVCSFVAQMMAYVSLPFFMLHSLGRSAVQTGLLMTPWPLMTAIMAPIAGRLADRYPAGILGGIGLAVFSRACLVGAGAGSPLVDQHRLAHGRVRHRVRAVPVAQQPGDHQCGATRAQRRRQRHARHRAASRADGRRGPGRADLWADRAGGHRCRARDRGRDRLCRGAGQLHAPDKAAPSPRATAHKRSQCGRQLSAGRNARRYPAAPFSIASARC
jgi:DHA2 family multidrug resistance protein-like MFS transporter